MSASLPPRGSNGVRKDPELLVYKRQFSRFARHPMRFRQQQKTTSPAVNLDRNSFAYTEHLVRRCFFPNAPRSTKVSDVLPALTSSNEVDAELYALIGLLKNQFLSWYGNFSDDSEFSEELINVCAHVIRGAEERIRKVDIAALLLTDVAQLLDNHILHFRESQMNFGTSLLPFATQAEAFHSLQPHFALNRESSEDKINVAQQEYLRLLARGAVLLLLPLEEAQCSIVRDFVQMLVADVVLQNTVEKVAEPYMMYELLEKLLEVLELKIGPNSEKSGSSEELKTNDLFKPDTISDVNGSVSSSTSSTSAFVPGKADNSEVNSLYEAVTKMDIMAAWPALRRQATSVLSAVANSVYAGGRIVALLASFSDNSLLPRFLGPKWGVFSGRSLGSGSETSGNSEFVNNSNTFESSAFHSDKFRLRSSLRDEPTVSYALLSLIVRIFRLEQRKPLLVGAVRAASRREFGQKLGRIVQRMISHMVSAGFSGSLLASLVNAGRRNLFPTDEFLGPPRVPPTEAEVRETRRRIRESILRVLPRNIHGHLLGDNPEVALEELLDVFGDKQINRHLVMYLLDCLVGVLFPELYEMSVKELEEMIK